MAVVVDDVSYRNRPNRASFSQHFAIRSLDDVKKLAIDSGIFEHAEIMQSIRFLHELGTLQHFSNEFLKDRVVIDPQWIVDVMACVVSVKDSPIKV